MYGDSSQLGLFQALIIGIGDFNNIAMRACIEDNLLIFCEGLINDEFKVV